MNGFVIPYTADDLVNARCARQNDSVSMIALKMDNGLKYRSIISKYFNLKILKILNNISLY